MLGFTVACGVSVSGDDAASFDCGCSLEGLHQTDCVFTVYCSSSSGLWGTPFGVACPNNGAVTIREWTNGGCFDPEVTNSAEWCETQCVEFADSLDPHNSDPLYPGSAFCESFQIVDMCTPAASCSSYDPAAAVANVRGTYLVDATFVAAVSAEPTLMLDCDAAVFAPQVSVPGFQLTGASSGDFLYELGLRNGDIPISLNSLSVSTIPEVMFAYGYLSFRNETEFELVVSRPTGQVTLHYEVTP